MSLTIPDSRPLVDLTDFYRAGMGIFISGRARSGKTSLEELLALYYFVGFDFNVKPESEMQYYEPRMVHWQFPKELVVVRDHGPWSWLALANLTLKDGRPVKLVVYIPRGAKCEPDGRQINRQNIKIHEFELADMWHTLFDELVKPCECGCLECRAGSHQKCQVPANQPNSCGDAWQYIHVIAFDKYCRGQLLLRSQFWRTFFIQLDDWKQEHKDFAMCLTIDEFQMITKTRRGGSQQKELKVESEIITDAIIADFPKYKIRLIASCNPPKAMDEYLRDQFPIWMLKGCSEAMLKGTAAEPVAPLTKNCKWHQVVVVHVAEPWGFNRFPFELKQSNSGINVHIELPPEGIHLGEPTDPKELRTTPTHAHNIRLIRYLHEVGIWNPAGRYFIKLTYVDISKMMGYKNSQGLQMYLHNWSPICERLGLLEAKGDYEKAPIIKATQSAVEAFTQDANENPKEVTSSSQLSQEAKIIQEKDSMEAEVSMAPAFYEVPAASEETPKEQREKRKPLPAEEVS